MLKNVRQNCKYTQLSCRLGSVVAILVALLALGARGELTPKVADGYLQWLHSLEQTVTGREAADQPESNLLFPYDRPGWLTEDVKPYRHLAISKAVTQLEGDWARRDQAGAYTALMALVNARNYVNLSEYDSALVWFDAAAAVDTAGNFRREIGRERLATAIALDDSTLVATLLTNTLGASELIGREGELILAYRWLLAEMDAEGVDLLIRKVESQQAVLSDRLRFWHAYALNWRQKRAESLDHLLKLVQSGGLSRDLTEGQRAWVLWAIPDQLFLAGDTATAADLYRVLSRSSIAELRLWGLYQTANLDLLAGRYQRAAKGFSDVCDAERTGSWQDQACAMADVAEEMERIRAEGEAYGTAAYYTP